MFYHLKSEYMTVTVFHHFGSFYKTNSKKKNYLYTFIYICNLCIDELYLDMS